MAEKKHQLLKVSLLLYALGALGYGVIYIFFPEWEIESSGSVAFPPGWIRWAGALFIALGIGSFMAFRNPVKQGILVTTLCILNFLNGLLLIYTVLFEYEEMGNPLRSLVPAIVILIMSLLFLISLRKSKEILW
jgi:hypothetical protein